MRPARLCTLAIVAGVAAWLAYPVAMMAGVHARWLVRCGHRTFGGRFDSCFNDALPILEILATLIAWLLTPLFWVVAYRLFAPADRQRAARWPLRGDPAAVWPLQLIPAGAGVAWTVWNLAAVPLQLRFVPISAYWLLFAAWFAAGAWLSRRPSLTA